MELKTYLAGMSVDDREDFASRCETSSAHLRNVGYGQRPCGEKLAVLVERESAHVVTRRDLRPDDWWLIWPELVTKDFPAPESGRTKEAA